MAFDIEGARKEGYSDSEIADYLAKQNNFDAAGARKEGYSDQEIINHIQPKLSLMQKADKFVNETPGLKQAGQAADFLGFGKMADSVKAIPSAIASIPGMAKEAWNNPASLIPTKQDVVNSLPFAAGLFAAPVLGPGASIPARMLATSLGTAGGEAAKAGIEGKNLPQTLEDVKNAAVMGAVAGATPEAQAEAAPTKVGTIAKMAEQNNLPMSASAINPSKTAKAFEWVGESLPTGKAWATMKRQQLQSGLTKMMDDFVESLPGKADKFDAGTSVVQGIKDAKVGLKASEKAAYKDFAGSLGTDAFSMPKTMEAINKIKDTSTGDLRAWLEAFAKKAKGTEWMPEDIDAFQSQIWKKLGNTPQGGEMFNALKEDVGSFSTSLLEKAKEQGQLLRTLSTNQTVKDVLKKYSQDPENAIRAMFRTGNMQDLSALKKSLSPEVWDIARSRFVENLFDAATEIDGTQRVFNPQKFADVYSKYQRQINQVMPEQAGYLKSFADLSKASVSDLNKLGMKSLMQEMPAQLLATGASGFGLGTGMVVPAAFSFIVSKSIMNPSGAFKKLLTTGYKMPDFAKKATTAGVLAVGTNPAIGQPND